MNKLGSDKKRNQILDSAAILFSQRGFDKTSIRYLAQDAKVSTSTIYGYFSDKNDLLLHCIQHRLSLLESQIETLLPDGGALDQLGRCLSLIHKFLINDPLLRKMMIFDAHVVDHRLYERADLARSRITEIALKAFRSAAVTEQLQCDDIEALEAVCRLSFLGWLLSTEHGGEEVSEARFTEMLNLLIRSLSR
jgi:AcrR family transcriptional regulator